MGLKTTFCHAFLLLAVAFVVVGCGARQSLPIPENDVVDTTAY